MEQKKSGAGLGLISTLRSVSKLVFNMAPTSSTEVIGLFDMELPTHGMVGARSLHLFTATSSAEAVEEEGSAEGAAGRIRPRARALGWAAAALVGAAVAGLGTAYVLERGRRPVASAGASRAPAAASPTVTVFPDPATAEVAIDGVPVSPGVPVPILRSEPAAEIEIRVTEAGYRTWSRTILASELAGGERIYVRLDRER